MTATKRTVAALVAAAVSIAGVACGDFTGVPASLPTLSDSGVVYAINGSPPGAPTALSLFTGRLISADAGFFFDLAFDIDAAGNPVILPQRVVASGVATVIASTHSVGLQTVSSAFESIDKAPKSGYRADTALVTRPGQVILVQSRDPNVCGISLTGTTIYAKLIVLALDPATRQLNVRYTVDPNCGFLSFAPGVPKE